MYAARSKNSADSASPYPCTLSLTLSNIRIRGMILNRRHDTDHARLLAITPERNLNPTRTVQEYERMIGTMPFDEMDHELLDEDDLEANPNPSPHDTQQQPLPQPQTCEYLHHPAGTHRPVWGVQPRVGFDGQQHHPEEQVHQHAGSERGLPSTLATPPT